MDEEISNMMIENTESVFQFRTENVIDPDPANVNVISDASDEQTEDENVMKNKKRKIANVDGKNKKDASMTKSKDLKRKHPSTAEMVMASIKSLRKRKGASLKDISKYMEENYEVNAKRLKLHINRFLEGSVESDTLEKVSGNADAERFKIKKAEKEKKVEKVKAEKAKKEKKVEKVKAEKAKKEKKVKENAKQNLMEKGEKKKQGKTTTEKRQVKK